MWTREYWPDSVNGVQGAIEKVASGVAEIYYHAKSMNLVLVDGTGQKVGIRAVDIMQFEKDELPELLTLEGAPAQAGGTK